MTDRAGFYILLLMDLGYYSEARAAQIYNGQLKRCRSERERAEKCYLILERRRQEIGEAPIYEQKG